MKSIQLEATPELKQLLKDMGSKNRTESLAAQEIFAEFLQPTAKKVLDNASTSAAIFKTVTYEDSERPSFPLDLYYDEGEGYVTVWSQSRAGGIPSSEVAGIDELKFTTYTIESAVNIKKQYARHANVGVASKAVNRMVSEMREQQERNAWAVVMKMLATASTNGADHIITSGTQDSFQIDDLNNMITEFDDINTSFTGGTPINGYSQLTDIFVSSRTMGQVRAFAYNPINAKGANSATGDANSGVIALPENLRGEFFRSGEAADLLGITFHKVLELGDNKKWSALFDGFVGTSTVAHGSSQFATDDQLAIGMDLQRDAFIRPVSLESETNAEIAVGVDDQFLTREDKMGWWAKIEEGRLCIDARAIIGVVI